LLAEAAVRSASGRGRRRDGQRDGPHFHHVLLLLLAQRTECEQARSAWQRAGRAHRARAEVEGAAAAVARRLTDATTVFCNMACAVTGAGTRLFRRRRRRRRRRLLLALALGGGRRQAGGVRGAARRRRRDDAQGCTGGAGGSWPAAHTQRARIGRVRHRARLQLQRTRARQSAACTHRGAGAAALGRRPSAAACWAARNGAARDSAKNDDI
jgi:hypothetical protein